MAPTTPRQRPGAWAPAAVDAVSPPGQLAPPVRARRSLAAWLRAAGGQGDLLAIADLAVGAAEARGHLSWVGPQLVEEHANSWAVRVTRTILSASGLTGGASG